MAMSKPKKPATSKDSEKLAGAAGKKYGETKTVEYSGMFTTTSISLNIETLDEMQNIAFTNKKIRGDNATVSRIIQNALDEYLPKIRKK